MASRIAGITIEIDGNTTKLQQALADVNKTLKTCDTNIKDIEKGLKLDPGNLTLWQQKQEAINTALDAAREKLQTLKDAQSQYTEGSDEWNNLQTEIGLTEAAIANYEGKADEAAQMTAQLSGEVGDAGDSADGTSGDMSDLGDATRDAGDAASSSQQGWTILKSVIADLAKDAIKSAIDGLKKLGSAMKGAVTDSAEFADEVNTLAKQTHLSTDTIQELYYATELMDVPVETVSKSLTKLTNTMSDAADGSDSAGEKFAALGISVTNADGSMRSAEDVFMDAVDALGGIENEAERDAAAYDLFGRSAKELNPLIEMGSEGFAELKQEAHDAGAVMDGETLDSLNDVSDSMERMEQAGMVVQRSFASALAPAITAVSDALTSMANDADWQDLFSDLGESIAEILPDLISMAKTVLPAVINIVRQLMPTISQIISYLPQLQPIIDAILMVVQRLTPIIMKLVSQLLPPLIDIIVAILPILEPILDILEPLLDILGPLLSAVLSALSIAIKALVQIIAGSLQPVIEALRKAAEKVAPVFENMGKTLQNVQHTMGNAWTAITSAATTALNAINSKVSSVWNAIKSVTTSVWNGIKSAIIDPIKSAYDKVVGIINNIKSAFNNMTLKLPNIKLPHFRVTGTWSFNPPRVPSFSVSWYAKAMQNGLIFNTPTTFGWDGTKQMVAGEAGAEALVGVRSLRDMIVGAIQSQPTMGDVNIVVYGAPGQNVNELADIIEDRINNKIMRRGFAV